MKQCNPKFACQPIPQLHESLLSLVDELADQSEYQRLDAKEEVNDIIQVLIENNFANSKVFKDICIMLAGHCGCPKQALGIKLSSSDKQTLQCGGSRCRKVTDGDKTDMCWNIYYYGQIRGMVMDNAKR